MLRRGRDELAVSLVVSKPHCTAAARGEVAEGLIEDEPSEDIVGIGCVECPGRSCQVKVMTRSFGIL